MKPLVHKPKWTQDLTWVTRSFLFLGLYGLWIFLFQMLVVTLWTYLGMASSANLQSISEEIGSIEIHSAGVGAFLFTLLYGLLYPITSVPAKEIYALSRFRQFLPGAAQGLVLGLSLTVALILSGFYKFLGMFVQVDETLAAIFYVTVRAIALVLLVYAEEFIFRQKLLSLLRDRLPPITVASLISVAYCLTKAMQFDLGWMHLLTLFLLSMFLTLRAITRREFVYGAGFWASLLILFHAVLGLPIFGNEFNGIFLFTYSSAGFEFSEVAPRVALFLTGGLGGPLSSFVLQVMFLIHLTKSIIQDRYFLFHGSRRLETR